MFKDLTLVSLAIVSVLACSSPTNPTTTTSTTTTTTTTTTSAGAPAMYARFQSAVTVSVDGSTIVLRSNAVPDHKSPYWGTGNALYEAPHDGMVVNPNRIVSQTLTLRVPANPAVASSASDTPMGPIGMAVNGVPLFNQYAAGRSPLTSEIATFDRYNGHPQQTGQYHYHLEPAWLTAGNGPSSLIGVLLDGFPVYGPKETSGAAPTGLDSCNGHTHATADVPAGLYHYHVTTVSPYISGCYKGTAGAIG
ncbi:MAG: YHYH protein [Acidobacteria bacterium]|nr:YHYH protein [Acidobacteriota bacterium]